MIRRFLGAVQFLTIVPVRGRTSSPGEAAIFFPLTGALLGAAAGAVMSISNALFALAALIVITGCLHEDGLADVADAVRAGRSQEKMMDILKDSRIGTYGAIALILSVALRWRALSQSVVNPVAGLAAALALSRTSLVALAATALPVGTGMGRVFAASCSRAVLAQTAGECIAIVALSAVFIGWFHGLAMIGATAATVFLARVYFTKRLGGVNGDCLGATCQVVETINLMILAWHPSF
jgi:adenosylcobinamide-GDP ribazoletransferase